MIAEVLLKLILQLAVNLQWGYLAGSQGAKTISLNIAFNSTNYVVLLTPQGSGSRGLSGSNYKNKSRNSFIAQYWTYDGADAVNGINWLAAGV